MARAREAAAQLAAGPVAEADEQSQYLIPLAFRKRTLFKMDFAEALYISELRTGPRDTSPIATWPMRCTKPWRSDIPTWRSISA